MSIVVVVVYLLATVVSRLSPAESVVAAPVLSSNPAHRCGLVPCAPSASVIDFELSPAGADGTAFITKVSVSSSSCSMVSGVPCALNLKLMLPLEAPV